MGFDGLPYTRLNFQSNPFPFAACCWCCCTVLCGSLELNHGERYAAQIYSPCSSFNTLDVAHCWFRTGYHADENGSIAFKPGQKSHPLRQPLILSFSTSNGPPHTRAMPFCLSWSTLLLISFVAACCCCVWLCSKRPSDAHGRPPACHGLLSHSQPPHGALHIPWSDCAGACRQGVCVRPCVQLADSRCACDAAAAVTAGMPPCLALLLQT